MIEWLEVAQRVREPLELPGGNIMTEAALRAGWTHEELGDSVNGSFVGMVGETRFPKSFSREPHLGKGTGVFVGRGS